MVTFNFDKAVAAATDPRVLAFLMENQATLTDLGLSVWLEIKALLSHGQFEAAMARLTSALDWLALRAEAAKDVLGTADVAARAKKAKEQIGELTMALAKGVLGALAAAIIL